MVSIWIQSGPLSPHVASAVTVEYILGLLAHGIFMEAILEEYPGLAKDDIYACLLFASKSLQDASFVPIGAEAV